MIIGNSSHWRVGVAAKENISNLRRDVTTDRQKSKIVYLQCQGISDRSEVKYCHYHALNQLCLQIAPLHPDENNMKYIGVRLH